MHHIPGLYITEDQETGRGVYTATDIAKDTIIELCPILTIPQSDLPIIHKTVLHDYYFLWGEDLEEAAIALGYGSLYNHALYPNANFILDLERKEIEFVAISDIEAGSQITINYHGEPGCDDDLWFKMG